MTREQKYAEQLKREGIYLDTFDPAIHTLAEMERDLQRIRKAWKDAGSGIDSPEWRAMESMRRDILSHRDALGLTPKAMKRMKGTAWIEASEKDMEDKPKTMMELLQEKRRSTA